MRINLLVFLSFILLYSCSRNPKIPQVLSETLPSSFNLPPAKYPVNSVITNTSGSIDIDHVYKFYKQYEEKNTDFNVPVFQSDWDHLKSQINYGIIDSVAIARWIKATGLLLQLTAETKYADELERLILCDALNGKEQIWPFIFTKNTDHLFTNVFFPGKVEYDHTLGGKVKVEMVTDYPNSGKVDLKFTMTEKRYIELFIRIPEWAEGTSVVVKKVKYFAAPGTYCKIAKKWRQGDLVEIQFPEDKIPSDLNGLLVNNSN